ncbi:MAG: glycoside hydrolase family 18 protein [Planctomycetota bacterium]|nr:glycoside hydrolase family 18 protein [Planctomycetota bacterium]
MPVTSKYHHPLAALLLLVMAFGFLGSESSAQLGMHGQAKKRQPVDRKVVGYFIEWGVYARDYHALDIPADKLTHINYAFANIGSDLRIAQGDPYAATDKYYPGDTWDQPYRGAYNQLNNVLKPMYPHLKTLISVGGWTWSGLFSDVALTSQSRETFAESCVEFIRAYNFDGVDIDWEYPVCCGLSGNTNRPEDKQNYTLLMAELRSQLDAAEVEDGREYLLTIAAAAGYDKMENYELLEISQHLDWVNVMTYDLRGAWDMTVTANHSPLFANPNDPLAGTDIGEKYNTDWAMKEWALAGVPKNKLVMGVPFYGRAWGGVPAMEGGLFQPGTHVPAGTWDDWSSGATGFNEWWEIEQFEDSGAYLKFWDRASQTPWLYAPNLEGGHFIGYNDEHSLQLKVDHVRQEGYGGMMYWELSSDRTQTLIDVVHGVLH